MQCGHTIANELIKCNSLYNYSGVYSRSVLSMKRSERQMYVVYFVQELARKREELSSRLPDEPESSNPDAVRIVVRLPHGERMDRRFLKTDRLQV